MSLRKVNDKYGDFAETDDVVERGLVEDVPYDGVGDIGEVHRANLIECSGRGSELFDVLHGVGHSSGSVADVVEEHRLQIITTV